MGAGLGLRAKGSVRGQMKLAALLALSEEEFSARVDALEGDPLFARLRAAGAVTLEPFEGARFAARRFDGWSLRADAGGEGLDGASEPVKLIEKIGQELFEEWFLRDAGASDAARARACGVAAAEAKILREFVDRLYIQQEMSASAPASAPDRRAQSAVAGVSIENGAPVLAFFNRPIWKGRYRVDAAKYALLRDGLGARDAARAEALLRKLEFVDRRKSTLYRTLEEILRAQADYLLSGDPARRRPLTQRALADAAGTSASVLNRLIAGKSVQLPWGVEAPLRAFAPSAKTLLKDRLHSLAVAAPDASDAELARALERETGASLSRRSIAQYRQDLSLPARGRRH